MNYCTHLFPFWGAKYLCQGLSLIWGSFLILGSSPSWGLVGWGEFVAWFMHVSTSHLAFRVAMLFLTHCVLPGLDGVRGTSVCWKRIHSDGRAGGVAGGQAAMRADAPWRPCIVMSQAGAMHGHDLACFRLVRV